MYTDIFGKTRVKVGLHQHTTRSDGALTPMEMTALYRENGYDAVAQKGDVDKFIRFISPEKAQACRVTVKIFVGMYSVHITGQYITVILLIAGCAQNFKNFFSTIDFPLIVAALIPEAFR